MSKDRLIAEIRMLISLMVFTSFEILSFIQAFLFFP